MMIILLGLVMLLILIKLGETTIITDPVFSKNAGPLIFGPKRFTEPALKLKRNSKNRCISINSQSL